MAFVVADTDSQGIAAAEDIPDSVVDILLERPLLVVVAAEDNRGNQCCMGYSPEASPGRNLQGGTQGRVRKGWWDRGLDH